MCLYCACFYSFCFMSTPTDIINKYLNYIKKNYKDFDKNILFIKKACDVAKIAHQWQFRRLTWTPFIIHPMKVAVMVSWKTDDLSLIISAILHDVVEDSADKFSMEYIYKEFWNDVWFLVDSVTDNILFYLQNSEKKFKDKIDKLLYWTMKDPRCAFLKLTDRAHNNKTLNWLEADKQIRKSFETQALYNPLKKLLWVDNRAFNLEKAVSNFSDYIKQNKIKTVDDLKLFLYKNTFQDIDGYNFDIFYKKSNNIVWEISDKDMFKKLINNNYFDKRTEILSMKEDAVGNFSCFFKYEKWKVYEDEIKVKVSSFKY